MYTPTKYVPQKVVAICGKHVFNALHSMCDEQETPA